MITITYTPKNYMATISPITNKQQDILWRVFRLIAGSRERPSDDKRTLEEEIKDHPLTTIRHFRQVFFTRRRLIVESSSLWGKIIDVDVLGKISERWRSLIMARTKESALCVYGEVDGKHEVTRNFFTTLLSNEWFRILDTAVSILSSELFED